MSNPFLDDDEEVGDFEFLNNPRQGPTGYMLSKEPNFQEQNQWEIKKMQLLEERRKIQERTLQSTTTSLGILHESEQVGVLTAEELVRQREQLQNIEENLGIINNTMRTSQKHINSLKSIFGGIKNYFSKGEASDSAVKPPADIPASKLMTSKLRDTVDNLKTDTKFSESTHPAFRVRDMPYTSDSDVEVYKDRVQQAGASFAPDAEDQLDKNLENLSMGLGRLKNLAISLNEEIEQQNDIIDVINTKADKADETLVHQNLQIKRILKK